MSCDGCVALPRGAMGLSAVCDCGISWSYPLTIFVVSDKKIFKVFIWKIYFEHMGPRYATGWNRLNNY